MMMTRLNLLRVAIHHQPLWPKYMLPRRTFAVDQSTTTAAPISKKSSGGGFFQRISSFLVGAGLTALGTQYYLYEEIKQGNKELMSKQREIEAKIALLEKKL